MNSLSLILDASCLLANHKCTAADYQPKKIESNKTNSRGYSHHINSSLKKTFFLYRSQHLIFYTYTHLRLFCHSPFRQMSFPLLLIFSLVCSLVSCDGIRTALPSAGNESLATSSSYVVFTGINPASGSALGGYKVTISWTNLLSFNGLIVPHLQIINDGCDWLFSKHEFCPLAPSLLQDNALTFVMPPGGGNGQSKIHLYLTEDTTTLGGVYYTFTYTSDLLSITQVVPVTIPQTGGNITISGTNFGTLQGKVAFYDNIFFASATPLTVISWNSARIVCTAPVGSGIFGLRVFSANGSYSPALPYSYTPLKTDPFIKNLTTDGVSFTITGSNFGNIQGDNGGVFANSIASGFVGNFPTISWSPIKIVFQNIMGASGSGSSLVVITSAGLQSAQYVPYEFVPFVAGLSPSSASVIGGGSLTITGSTFDPDYSIVTLIGNGSSIQLSCNPGLDTYTSMVCQLPPAPAGTYVVVVKTPAVSSAALVSSSSVATASNTFTYVSCVSKNTTNPSCSCLLTLPICYSVATLPLVQTPAISGSLTLTYSVSQTASGYVFAQNSYVKVNTTILVNTNVNVKVNPSSVALISASSWDGGLPADLGCICA